MEDPSAFASRLDVALRSRSVGKMMALAAALSVDESALSRWRRGKPISVRNLVRLSRHLGVSIDWLLTGTGSMDAKIVDADGAWKSEVMADLASLDPTTRRRVVDLLRHLAEAGRGDRRLSERRGGDG